MTGIKNNQNALFSVLREQLSEKSSHEWKEPGNKFDHGIRVAKIAEQLRLAICPNDTSVNPDLLRVAAWFHDLCNGRPHHAEEAAERLPALIGALCTEEELDTLCDVIRVHDARVVAPEESPYPVIVKLLQDADLLDHLGTYDIWISFAEYSHQHKSPYSYTRIFQDGTFDGYVKKWRSQLNYPDSIAIFDEKIAFERQFASRFDRELNGEIFV